MSDNNKFKMLAKTLSGLEDLLAAELRSLGASDVKAMNRSAEFFGDKKMLYKANMHCRLATRILKQVKTFNATSSDELYHHVSQIKWDKLMRLSQTFAIDAVINYSEFNNSMFVAQKVKDAIADWFRAKYDKRPSVDIKRPNVRINIHIRAKKATLSLDSSGEALSKRGYRTEAGTAPLGEVLAAGIIELTRWDRASSFIDSMCGSGTFVIEAAQMARNMAPGLTRKGFGFMGWRDYDESILRDLVEEAQAAIKPNLDFKIVGSDIEPARIKEAMANAKRARVGKDIEFVCKSFEKQEPPPAPGVMVINPPYGERMVITRIDEFYTMIGDTLKQNYEGYNAFVLTSNLDSIKHVGLRTSQRVKLFNGPLECRLLKFEMYKGSRKEKYRNPEEKP
ncbi:MAG: hypothetical protein KAR42_07605 [candidate division Zixibacteria bacterium]|nr:hypothetical protein [candidate division Zixibacteria bacterium]